MFQTVLGFKVSFLQQACARERPARMVGSQHLELGVDDSTRVIADLVTTCSDPIITSFIHPEPEQSP